MYKGVFCEGECRTATSITRGNNDDDFDTFEIEKDSEYKSNKTYN